jgi:uncharacterized protein YndB with AHSA1/START domain
MSADAGTRHVLVTRVFDALVEQVWTARVELEIP